MWWAADRRRKTTLRFIEDIVAWMEARPRSLNRIEQYGATRFHETGQELIEELVSAIACGQHVAIAGPRGCGKSYCVDQAIRLAEKRGLIPQNGFVKLQGNKELPRDYLIEDDVTLAVEEGVVVPKRKDAPLFRFARRHETGDRRGRPVKTGDGYVLCHGLDDNYNLIPSENALERNQRIVLFLDEVNRFSDGILDSLLLLLEEGEVVMGGEVFKLPIVVLMTMNPPGYDASARTLSPPLSARIGRQYRLLSPKLDVLTDLIAVSVVRNLAERVGNEVGNEIKLVPPALALVRRAAAVTLCAWGDPRSGNPGFEYLSGETHKLLIGMAESSAQVGSAMRTLNRLCHFGPDARALGDWIVASSVAAIKEARGSRKFVAVPENKHFISTAVTVLSHKLQDNFSSATRPDNTTMKERAIQTLVSSLLSESRHVDALLRRPLDDVDVLREAFVGLAYDLDPHEARGQLVEMGLTDRRDLECWIAFLKALGERGKGAETMDGARSLVIAGMLEAGLLESDQGEVFLTSEIYRSVLIWLAGTVEQGGEAIGQIFADMAETPVLSEPHTLEGYAFIAEGLWKKHATVRHLIQEEHLGNLHRDGLIELFSTLDQCWLVAEHDALALLDRLEALVKPRTDGPDIPKGLLVDIASFVVRSLKLMEQHPDRGGGTRKLLRRFEDSCERAGLLSSPRIRGTTGDASGLGGSAMPPSAHRAPFWRSLSAWG